MAIDGCPDVVMLVVFHSPVVFIVSLKGGGGLSVSGHVPLKELLYLFYFWAIGHGVSIVFGSGMDNLTPEVLDVNSLSGETVRLLTSLVMLHSLFA